MTIQTAPPGAAPPGSAEAADQAGHITPWQNCYCSTQLLGALITHRRAADSGKEMAPALLGLAITIAYLAIALTS